MSTRALAEIALRFGALVRPRVLTRGCCAVLACVVIAILVSCAETGPRNDQSLITANSSASAPGEILQQLAQQESTARNLQPIDVPAPPGVSPDALVLADPADAKAKMSYDRALRELAENETAKAAREAPRAWLDDPSLDAEKAVEHYVRGRDASQRQQYDVAIRELLLAHNYDAHSTTVARELARVYAVVRNQSASTELYEHLLALAPNDAEASLAVALYAADRRDFEQAGYLLATHRLARGNFEFDPAGEALALSCTFNVFDALGYDRAAAEAGERAIKRLDSPPAPGMYATQFGTIYRQRGELWRRIGDAQCRLGSFADALESYNQSAALPAADAWELLPRRMFAMLRVGRAYGAKYALYQQLAKEPAETRDVRLCTFVAEYVPHRELLADAVLELHHASPDQPGLVRCAAALVDRSRAIEILHAFVNDNADDLGVLQQFLDWLAREDLDAVVDLCTSLTEREPGRIDQITACAIHAAIDPTPLIAALKRGEPSPTRSALFASVQSKLGAIGEAWTIATQAAQQWPDSALIARQRISIAAELQEPALVDEALAEAERFNDVATWVARAQTHRAMTEYVQAQNAASQAMTLAPDDLEALLELARTQATVALAQPSSADARLHALDATQTLERVLELKPSEEQAYELLLFLYGSEGPLTSVSSVESYTARLASANPNSPLLKRLSLETAFRQQRFDRAVELAIELYEQMPSDGTMLNYAVSAWSTMKSLDAAEAWFEERRANRQQDPVLLEPWVRVMIMRGENVDVSHALESLLEESPQNFRAAQLLEAVYRSLGDFNRALALGEQRLVARPEGVQRELARASMLAEAAQDQRAAARLQWIADHGSNASLDQLSAAIQIADTIETPDEIRHALVLTLVDRIVLDHPDVSMASYLAGLQAMRGLPAMDGPRLEALLNCLVQRATMDKTSGRVAAALWREVAQQLIDLGAPEGASRLLRARLAADQAPEPQTTAALLLGAIIADAAGGVPVDETIELIEETFLLADFSRSLQTARSIALSDLLFAAGNLHTLLGDSGAAERFFRRCLELSPNDSMTLNNLGYQRIDEGYDDAESIAMLENAYKAEPNNPNVLDSLGWLRYKQGLLEDTAQAGMQPNGAAEGDNKPQLVRMQPGAISLIRRAVDLTTEPSPEVYVHLGDALWRRGDKNGAIEQWRRALSLLEDERRKSDLINNYLFAQRDTWGLIVIDPNEVYEREFGVMRDQTERKINQAVGGAQPDVAPLFEGVEIKKDE